MPTQQQLINGTRRAKRRKNNRKDLDACPQKKAVCIRVFHMTPRKPNSALRKVAWIRISNRKKTHAYIPGMGHTLQKHSVVLIRGGRIKDLPGMKYTIIRGKFDLKPLRTCGKSRSKYGVKKVEKPGDHTYRKYKYW